MSKRVNEENKVNEETEVKDDHSLIEIMGAMMVRSSVDHGVK